MAGPAGEGVAKRRGGIPPEPIYFISVVTVGMMASAQIL